MPYCYAARPSSAASTHVGTAPEPGYTPTEFPRASSDPCGKERYLRLALAAPRLEEGTRVCQRWLASSYGSCWETSS